MLPALTITNHPSFLCGSKKKYWLNNECIMTTALTDSFVDAVAYNYTSCFITEMHNLISQSVQIAFNQGRTGEALLYPAFNLECNICTMDDTVRYTIGTIKRAVQSKNDRNNIYELLSCIQQHLLRLSLSVFHQEMQNAYTQGSTTRAQQPKAIEF